MSNSTFKDALNLAFLTLNITNREALSTAPYVMFGVARDWSKFRQTLLFEPDNTGILDTSEDSNNVLKLRNVRFVLRSRPEPRAVSLQTGQWVDLEPETGLVKAIRFSDQSVFDTKEGWK